MLATPAVATAQESSILESAERAALELGIAAAVQSEEEERRRSWGRTWGGIALIVGGLFVPVQHEVCVTLFFSTSCVDEAYGPGIGIAAGLITGGVLLTTVWSDVPVARDLDVQAGPGRFTIGRTFGF